MLARTTLASTASWLAPARVPTWAAVSGKRRSSTSSIAPVNPVPTVKAAALLPEAGQAETSSVVPVGVPQVLVTAAASPSA